MPGTLVTVAVTVERHRAPPPGRSRAPYLIYASDETGDLVIAYFNARREYLEKLLPVDRRYVSGAVALYDGMLQMAHPDRVVAETELATLPLIEPVYPLTEGLTANQVHRAIEAALDKLRRCRIGRMQLSSRAPVFPLSPMRCGEFTILPRLTMCSPARPPGHGFPMTSSSPASSR